MYFGTIQRELLPAGRLGYILEEKKKNSIFSLRTLVTGLKSIQAVEGDERRFHGLGCPLLSSLVGGFLWLAD